MPISIAHQPPISGGKSAAEVEVEDLRDLLAAIRDALDVPPGPQRAALLGDRVLLVGGVLRDVLDGTPGLDIPWDTDYLRRYGTEGGSRA